METKDRKELFDKFCDIIEKLRAPDGCPWDRKQTAESLRKSLMEECDEAIEAIDKKDDENLCEELGDVLLVVGMIARIKEEEGKFNISDVLSGVNSKLIRRHPHVFGDAKASSPEEVLKLWNQVKEEEKKMISKWIHPKKIIRFNMLYSANKDGDRSSTFHYYCDGIFPTLTVIEFPLNPHFSWRYSLRVLLPSPNSLTIISCLIVLNNNGFYAVPKFLSVCVSLILTFVVPS